MQKELVVEAQLREAMGKNESRRLRRQGLIPGIVYGPGAQPIPIVVDPRNVLEILSGKGGANALFKLRLGGEGGGERTVMIREMQREPIGGRPIHADFVCLDLSREIIVKVSLHLVGIPVGVKAEGGLVEFVQREIEVSCLPADIPESVDVDISELHAGQHMSVGEVPLPERVKLLSDPGQTVVVIAHARLEEEVAAAPAEAAAAAPEEPEVIKKGKEGVGGEAAPPEKVKEKEKEKERGGKGESRKS